MEDVQPEDHRRNGLSDQAACVRVRPAKARVELGEIQLEKGRIRELGLGFVDLHADDRDVGFLKDTPPVERGLDTLAILVLVVRDDGEHESRRAARIGVARHLPETTLNRVMRLRPTVKKHHVAAVIELSQVHAKIPSSATQCAGQRANHLLSIVAAALTAAALTAAALTAAAALAAAALAAAATEGALALKAHHDPPAYLGAWLQKSSRVVWA